MNQLKLKRMFLVLALILVVGVSVTGCMNQAGDENVQSAPTADYMPQSATTVQPGATQSAGRFDWTRDAAQIEARLSQISEISEARVVVTGNTALVGVKFNQAYQGEMTERIREMVAAEIMAADPEITTVAVTADEDDVEDVYEISERTLAGREMDTLKEDINEIVRNATTLR